jgi:hypothetical protein
LKVRAIHTPAAYPGDVTRARDQDRPVAGDSRRPVDVTPSARRLTGSLRDIGYDFAAALADIVDNSIAAGASEVDVNIVFEGLSSYVAIADDGDGMTEAELHEALRFGTRRNYASRDLGRYGLGLKTASISQCRRVTVLSRRALNRRRVAAKTLDIDHIAHTDRWEVIEPPEDSAAHRCVELLEAGPGTVVCWEHLDRILPEKRPESGWARRRLELLAERATEYLGMVFHRFLEGDAGWDSPLTISVNGVKVRPWNPFASLEDQRKELPAQSFEVSVGDLYGRVILRRYVLPPRNQFSSLTEFERMSGPLKWNRQQGIYIYRANRLIQHGGWCGIRAADEHTKFARASLDFETDLDPLFQINVAKMKVALPPEVRTLVERPIHELCHRADAVYRREAGETRRDTTAGQVESSPRVSKSNAEIGTALMAAALDAGEHISFARVMEKLQLLSPELASALGW